MQRVVYTVFANVFLFTTVSGYTSVDSEREFLLHKNSEKYEPMWSRIERLGAPKFKPDGQTSVEMTLSLESISSVNEQKMDVGLTFNLRLVWTEPLLKFLNISGRRNFGSGRNLLTQIRDVEKYQFWTPDIEIIGQRIESDVIDLSSSLMRQRQRKGQNSVFDVISKDFSVRDETTMIMEVSMSTRIYCLMLFTHYPLDKQTCGLTFQSFSFHENELNLTWSPDQADKLFEHGQNNHMQKFYISNFFHDHHSPACLFGAERLKRSQLRLVVCFQRYFTAVFFEAYAPYRVVLQNS